MHTYRFDRKREAEQSETEQNVTLVSLSGEESKLERARYLFSLVLEVNESVRRGKGAEMKGDRA